MFHCRTDFSWFWLHHHQLRLCTLLVPLNSDETSCLIPLHLTPHQLHHLHRLWVGTMHVCEMEMGTVKIPPWQVAHTFLSQFRPLMCDDTFSELKDLKVMI